MNSMTYVLVIFDFPKPAPGTVKIANFCFVRKLAIFLFVIFPTFSPQKMRVEIYTHLAGVGYVVGEEGLVVEPLNVIHRSSHKLSAATVPFFVLWNGLLALAPTPSVQPRRLSSGRRLSVGRYIRKRGRNCRLAR